MKPGIGTVPRAYRKTRGADGLTDRERDVLWLMADGLKGPALGAELGLSKQRVSQIAGALEGLGLITRVGQVVYLSPPALRLLEDAGRLPGRVLGPHICGCVWCCQATPAINRGSGHAHCRG